MQSLKFDEGLKSFAINDDESRVIRFNPADPDMLPRYYKALEMIKAANSSLLKDVRLSATGEPGDGEDMAAAAQALEDVDGVIHQALNLMFNADVYDTVFAGQSPFCIVHGGKYLIEAFMESLQPVLESEIRAYQKASEKRMSKYLKGYQK